MSERESGGPISGSSPVYADDAPLTGATVPADRVGADHFTDERIRTAFTVAKTTGYFDPAVFPNVQSGNDASTLAAVVQALADLDPVTVTTQFKAGNRLAVYRDTSGRTTYRFIPVPQAGVPICCWSSTTGCPRTPPGTARAAPSRRSRCSPASGPGSG